MENVAVEKQKKQQNVHMQIKSGNTIQINTGKNVRTVEQKQKEQKQHIAIQMENVNVVRFQKQQKNVNIKTENGKQMKQNIGKYTKTVEKKYQEQ